MARKKKQLSKLQSTTIVELIAAGLGALMLIGAIGYLLYTAAVSDATAPDIEIAVGETQQATSGYVVAFTANNRSSFSAAKVKIRGELRSDGGEVIETTETELDYLPAYSSRRAGLYFQHDPAAGELKISPVAYAEP